MYGLLLFLFLFDFQRAEAGPKYVLNFDSAIWTCSDDDSQAFLDTSELETDRNETSAFLTGKIIFKKALDEDAMVEIKVFKAAPGGHSEMVFSHEICELCKEIGDTDSTYYKYLKYFGFPDKCPFEAGTYTVHDLIADTDDMPVNSSSEGRYQILLNIYRDPEKTCKGDMTFVGCAKFDFVIEPQLL